MLELNHGHIVTVASSLGLFSTAGIEVSVIHKGSYTSRYSRHLFFSCKAGTGPPLFLVVPPPVKLKGLG